MILVLKSEVCPVEIGIADGLGERMGKDSEVDTTETSDVFGTTTCTS